MAPLDRPRDSFPSLTLRGSTGWPEQLLDQVRHGEIDTVAFRLPEGVAPPIEMQAVALGPQDLFVVPATSLSLPIETSLQLVASLPWIINQDGCGFRVIPTLPDQN